MKINKETCFDEALIIESGIIGNDDKLLLQVGDTVKIVLEDDASFNDTDIYEGVLTFINSDGFGMEETREDGYPVIEWEYVIEIEKIDEE